MNITPLYDRVLIRKEAFVDPDATESSIITPDVAQDEPETGIVVAVGAGRILPDGTLRPLAVEVGQWVIMGKYSGCDVSILKDHALIREDEISAVIG